MKTRCLIVDDEPIAIRVIKNHLQNFENVEIVAECKSAVQAFEVLKQKEVDLMFLDIQMPKINGIDFLKTLTFPPKVIIVSAYRDFAIEGYALDVVDYLLKPVSFERFFKAMNKYYHTSSHEDVTIKTSAELDYSQFIYVKENKKNHKLYLYEIQYIESMKEYVKIVTSDREIISKNSLSNYEAKLASEHFIRIHKSFIIPISKIKSFSSTAIQLEKIELPISRTYKSSVFKALHVSENL